MAKTTSQLEEMGLRFKHVRVHLKLSQEKMASVCKLSQGDISKIEAGTRELSISILCILYLTYKISPLYVMLEEGEMIINDESNKKNSKYNIKTMHQDIELLKSEVEKLKYNG